MSERGGLAPQPETPIELFFEAASRDEKAASAALQTLASVWRDEYAALIVDIARLMRPTPPRGRASAPDIPMVDDETGDAAAQRQWENPGDAFRPSSPAARACERLTRFLERQTGKHFGDDFWAWRQWFSSLPYRPHPDYAAFKGALYSQIGRDAVQDAQGRWWRVTEEAASGPERRRRAESARRRSARVLVRVVRAVSLDGSHQVDGWPVAELHRLLSARLPRPWGFRPSVFYVTRRMIMHPITAGTVGGLLAGMVFGGMMQMMSAPTPDGGSMPMMQMVAQVVGSTSIAVGWLYHLFNSALIGAIFGWLFGARAVTIGRGLAWGAGYGLGWWVLGGLLLMPVMLGMAPFAPLMMAPMRPVAFGSLVGHLIYGLILGGAFPLLSRSRLPAAA